MVNQSRINSMETRQIELSLDTAKRLYEQGGEYRDIALTAFKEHELIGDRLPKTWQEFCAQNEVKIGECYLNDCCGLIEADEDGNTRDIVNDRNILPSKQAAKQHLALMQLHQLRDCYRDGWLPDGLSDVHGIEMYYDPSNGVVKVRVIKSHSISMFLSFQIEERAKEFLTNFRELIEEAWDLI